jgi:hypothetical protein
MAKLELTSQLAQLAECPASLTVDGDTLQAALDQLFSAHGQTRACIVDDHGAIHLHLAIFVDGQMIERDQLQVPLQANSQIFVMQALSGG